jgi:D-alanine-D-alanine ligase
VKVAIIHNKDLTGVINRLGVQNKERYNPKTVKLLAESLEKNGHNVRIIDGNMHVIEKLQEFMPRVIDGERMGMVFNMAYGIQGESRYTHLPSMLEMLGIPYVGSGPEGHALALDKVITKIIMQKQGIPTPHFWVFSTGDEDMSGVEFPAIVKPKMEAVSYGLSVIDNENDLRESVKFIISEFGQQALVEQFIRGREFCVGLLGNGDPEAFPVLEVDLEGDPDAIQTSDDKRKKPRGKVCPAEIPSLVAENMIELSKQAFRVLGLKDFCRVDIRMDEDQNIYLLEVNSMASLGRTGSYVHAAGVTGYDYTILVNKILDVAAVRYFSESDFTQTEEIKQIAKDKLPLSVRIRGFLRSRQGETEKLLIKMVNINTHVRNVEGVNALGSLIRNQLSRLGFTHEVFPQVDVGNRMFFSNTSSNEYDVLILGHLDNSTPFNKQVHYQETEQRLYGTAIWDSKGGLALLIAALRALRFVRLLRKLKVAILLTTDDSRQGLISKDHIREFSDRAGTIIGLSGAGSDGTVITSRSGAAVYNCQMNLVKPENAEDVAAADAGFCRLLSAIAELTNESEGVVVGLREVKIKSDIASLVSEGEAFLSVRTNVPEQAEEIDSKIRKLAKKMTRKKNKYQIEGGVRRLPMLRTDEVEKLYQQVRNLGTLLDIRILEEHRWSSADICFVDPLKAKVDGLGPIGGYHSSLDEYVLRNSMFDRASLLALLLHDLGKGTR